MYEADKEKKPLMTFLAERIYGATFYNSIYRICARVKMCLGNPMELNCCAAVIISTLFCFVPY